jgi:GYF domain 2
MSWHYSPDGKERKEVPDAVFQTLVQNGTIRPEMLVWRDGMTEWKPAGSVKPELFAPVAGSPPPVPPELAMSAPPTQAEWSQPPPMMLPMDSGASLSLICGITGIVAAGSGICCCFGHIGGVAFGLTAVIVGHASLARITAYPDQVRGRECAIAGLVTGYTALALAVGGVLFSLLTVGLSALANGPWFHHP